MGRWSSNNPICVGVGLCTLDFTFVVEPYPNLDDKMEAMAFSRQGGGPVPTALCALSKFGVAVAILGKCGNDPDGRSLRAELRRFGVNTKHLILDSDSRTPRAFILVERKSGKRTVVLDRTEASVLAPDEIDSKLIASAGYLLVDGRDPEASLTAAMIMKRAGGEVILDAGSPRRNIGDILPNVDHLVVSSRFSSDFTKEDDPGRAALKLARMGFKSVVITSGHRGCVAATPDGDLVEQDSFKVDVVDTTGAGDVFHGGFIYGLIQKWDLRHTLEFASAAAAIKCTRLGTRRGIPDTDEVTDFIDKFKKAYEPAELNSP